MTVQRSNFSPKGGSLTVAVLPTASSQRVAVTNSVQQGSDLYIFNGSNTLIAVNVGDSTVTAVLPVVGTPGNMVIPSLGSLVIDYPGSATNVAIISTGTPTGNVYLTPGLGNV